MIPRITVLASRVPMTVGIACIAVAGCKDPTPSVDTENVVRPLKIEIVSASDSRLRKSYPAIVLPAQQVEVSFRVSGQIIELSARAAQEVRKGEVLAKLDQRDFKAEVARLSSQLEKAWAELAAMKAGARSEDEAALRAGVESAQASVLAARQQLSRTETLYRKRVVTDARLDQDRESLAVAEAQLKARQAELAKGRAGSREEDLQAQEAVIRGIGVQLQSAENALSDTVLRAPFEGIVAKRELDNFSNVQANSPVLILQRLGTIDVNFDIPGPDVPILAEREKDLETRIELDAIPGRSFLARLVEFSTVPDPSTQTYRARVSIDPSQTIAILPGMTGRAIVVQKSGSDTRMTVPLGAVQSEANGTTYVWRVKKTDNTVSKVSVEMGEAQGDRVLIRSGLAIGNVIATAGVQSLRENMKVQPIAKVGN